MAFSTTQDDYTDEYEVEDRRAMMGKRDYDLSGYDEDDGDVA